MTSDDGTNLVPAGPTEIDASRRKFEEVSGLEVSDAAISRVDVAMNLMVARPVVSYGALMGERMGYKRHREENSFYLNSKSKERTLALYDKRQEIMDNHGFDPLDGSEGKHLARIELRILRHVERHARISKEMPALTMRTLATDYGMVAMVNTFDRFSRRLLGMVDAERRGRFERKKPLSVQRVENEAMRRLASKHSDELDRLIDEVIAEQGRNGEVVLEATYHRSLKRKVEEARSEVFNGIRRLCDEVYKEHPVTMKAQVKEQIDDEGVPRTGNVEYRTKEERFTNQ
ncbi:MAG: hypothetical protein JSS75_04075 [Bacteroidetes bacterium]|nr:hypothetical protein [Bacteroidota bacterium]